MIKFQKSHSFTSTRDLDRIFKDNIGRDNHEYFIEKIKKTLSGDIDKITSENIKKEDDNEDKKECIKENKIECDEEFVKVNKAPATEPLPRKLSKKRQQRKGFERPKYTRKKSYSLIGGVSLLQELQSIKKMKIR